MMGFMSNIANVDQILRERFGLATFRAGQREVIEQVLARRDVLCVMPTGGGKSLCYQLPALLLDGVTVVVSPLIALMKDQVDVLRSRGIRATLINSTLDPAEQTARIREVEAGEYDLVYIAPERFQSGRFVEAAAKTRLALLAVDEAHCISEWGHDFRPDYARIGSARKLLGMPPCIALTATATDHVRRDIAVQLQLREPALFVTGFDRPNLSYRVIKAGTEPEKLARLARIYDKIPGPSIIYASSRARCETVAEFAKTSLRKNAVVYHAGLTREERSQAQDRFMQGEADVVVATNAFGMGIDKTNIRSVVHFNLPGTLEAYYQEAGRAGRDGEPAHCVLFFAPGDRKLQELFIENEYPSREVIIGTYEFLRGIELDPIELTRQEIREGAGVSEGEQAVGAALGILEAAGGLERFRPRENMAIVRFNGDPDAFPLLNKNPSEQGSSTRAKVLGGLQALIGRRTGETIYFHPEAFAASLGIDRSALLRSLRALRDEWPIDYIPPFRGNAVRVVDRSRRGRDLEIDYRALYEKKEQEYQKLERMIQYATSSSCRRAFILDYFGDPKNERCDRCDRCEANDPAISERLPGLVSLTIETPAAREVVLKALSGVARAKGRFGKTTVAKMLAGSLSEKMKSWRLDELSTFGILRELKTDEIVRLIDALLSAKLVESREVGRFRQVVETTQAGREWLRLRGEAPLRIEIDDPLFQKLRLLERREKSAGTASGDDPPTHADSEPNEQPAENLAARLKSLRTSWARLAGISPAYVLTNETLDAIVRELPDTPAALAAIKGIGPSKLERYGAAILRAVREAASKSSNEPKAPELPLRPDARDDHLDSTALVTTEEWTSRLLEKGFSAREIAAIRGLEVATVVRHATKTAESGKAVPIEAFIDRRTLGEWESVYRSDRECPSHADPLLWGLFRSCRSLSSREESRAS